LAVIDMMLLNFAPAILSKRLAELHVDSKLYGLFFALPFVFPIVSAVIVVKVMDKIDSQILLCIGKLLMGIAFLLIGPSYYWGFHENIWVMLAGISLLGFSASFAIIPLMPIIMAELKEKFVENTSNYIDTASSLYNSAFGLGSIIGPILGAHLNAYFGFRI
jgi:MFS family permease